MSTITQAIILTACLVAASLVIAAGLLRCKVCNGYHEEEDCHNHEP